MRNDDNKASESFETKKDGLGDNLAALQDSSTPSLVDPEESLRLTPSLGKVSVNSKPVAKIKGRKKEELGEIEREQLVAVYFQTGNLSQISRDLLVDYNDLLEMAKEGWFQEGLKQLEKEAQAQLKVRLTKILGQTLGELEDRLEHGDLKWYEGGLRNVPVSAKDLSAISANIFAKRKALEDQNEGFGGNEAKRLMDLAQAVRMMAGKREPEVIDGELVDEGKADGQTS